MDSNNFKEDIPKNDESNNPRNDNDDIKKFD